MTEEYIMMQDIIQEHKERIFNLKKYYPYFKLADNAMLQWKEGKYSCLDMGYITLAVLRFFIDENNLKDKEVKYEEYESKELMSQELDMFGLYLTNNPITELKLKYNNNYFVPLSIAWKILLMLRLLQ